MSLWDSVTIRHQYAALPAPFYRRVTPQPLASIRWAIWNRVLAADFNLPDDLSSPELSAEMARQFNGQNPHAPFVPLAMKYAGHQFGAYNPDLGDGRGLLLAEIQQRSGDWYDLHIKGSGLTPFSRMGDGRAVIRSTVREYLASEALAGLGLKTTRALGMLVSDTPVFREQQERGALLLRVAKTHIRFGHFEHFYYTKQHDELQLLADKVIEWYFPHCQRQTQPYLAMFNEIVERTADMIAHWQSVGFNHGVMNTDNMSILGETFDFGPYAFLDDYDASYVCNHSDYQGRYAFSQQPSIGLWNLTALAQALSGLIEISDLKQALEGYQDRLTATFSRLMRQKLGLLSNQAGDTELFNDMFSLLQTHHIDYCRFLRALSELDWEELDVVYDLALDREAVKDWLQRYLTRCQQEHDSEGAVISASERCRAMRAVNPKYILRNYLAQNAIEKAEQGDFSELQRLAEILKHPYDEQPEHQAYANLPPQWGKSMEISCSS